MVRHAGLWLLCIKLRTGSTPVLRPIFERNCEMAKPYHCLFCGKPNEEVKKMFCSEETKCICNDCLDLCKGIDENGEKEIVINLNLDLPKRMLKKLEG